MTEKHFNQIYGPLNQIELEKPLFVSKETTVFEIITQMKQQRAENAMVIEDDKLIGFISATDLVKFCYLKNDTPLDLNAFIAETVMVPRPMTNDVSESIFDCMGKMVVNKFRHLPILDKERPVGVLTIRNLLYFVSDRMIFDDSKLGEVIRSHGQIKLLEIIPDIESTNTDDSIFSVPLTRIVTAPLTEIDLNESLLSLVKAMKLTRAPCSIVIQWGTKMAGIITLKDVLTKHMAKSSDFDPSTGLVKDYMTKNPSYLMYYQWVGHALNAMIQGNFRNIPVVNEDVSIIKAVGLHDILSYLYIEIKTRKETKVA